MKTKNVLALGLVYVIIARAFFSQIEGSIGVISNINLWIVTITVAGLLIYSWKDLVAGLKEHRKALLIILIIAFAVKLLLFQKAYGMTMDEPININYAKNAVMQGSLVVCEEYIPGSCTFSFQAPGFGFIISVFFLLFGKMHMLAFYLNSVIGSLTVALVYIVTFQLFSSKKASLIAAGLAILYQTHSIYSSTANSMVPGIFLMFASISAFLAYKKSGEFWALLLSMLVACMAAYVRLELAIVPALIFLAVLFKEKLDEKQTNVFSSAFVLGLFSFPFVFKRIFEIHTQSLAPKTAISIQTLVADSLVELKNFLTGKYYPVILLLLAVIGIVYLFKEKNRHVLFLLIIPVFLFIVYNTYDNLGRERFFMNIVFFLIILSAKGFNDACMINRKWKTIAVILLAVGGLMMINIYQVKYWQESNGMALLTKLPQKVGEKISGCVVVAEEPLFLSAANDVRTLSISYLEENRISAQKRLSDESCVLLFEDKIYCEKRKNRCEDIKQGYKGRVFLIERENNEKYTFYRLTT